MSDLNDRTKGARSIESSLAEINSYSIFNENMMPNPPKERDRWTGIVVSNDDPLRLGRIKVNIPGIYDEVDVEFLPWAIPEDTWVGSKVANLVVPEVGTTIRGIFDNGDLYKPIYIGKITNYSGADESGDPSVAEDLRESLLNGSDYPETMLLFSTDDGESVTVNRSTGLMKISHRSGLMIYITSNGSIKIEQKSDESQESKPSMDVSIVGKLNLTSKDDLSIQSSNNVYIESVKGEVHLGNAETKELVCAHPVCFVTGAPTNGFNTTVKA